MKTILSVVLIVGSFVIFGIRISKSIDLKQEVTGYLKRAAHANSIELANQELSKTIAYLETNKLTSGYTSVFWRTPDDDIGFWYKNLKASQNLLQNLKSESTLEESNVLIKLRETIMSSGEKSKVIVPQGLAVYPNNGMWAILMIIAILAGFVGIMIPIIAAEEKSKNFKTEAN